jgi:hypothetical protein
VEGVAVRLTDKERAALRALYVELRGMNAPTRGHPYLLPLKATDVRALRKLIFEEEGLRIADLPTPIRQP